MSLINHLFFAILLTTLTGTFFYGSWRLLQWFLKRYGYCQYAYRYLVYGIPFWLVPVLYLCLFFRYNKYDENMEGWVTEGLLFFQTNDIMFVEKRCAVIWMIGAAIVVWRQIRGYYRIIWKVNRHAFPANPKKQEVFKAIQKMTGMKKRVRLMECYGVESPFVTGVFRPKIILPSHEYERKELEAVISHELIHVKQRVLFWKLAGMLTEALHWFNPLCFRVSRDLDRQAEIACDIRACFYENGSYSTKEYFMVALHEENPQQMAAYTLFGKLNYLEERIMIIKNFKKKELNKAAMAGLAVLLLAQSAVTTYAASLGFEYASNAYYGTVLEEEDVTDTWGENLPPVFEEDFDETAQNIEQGEWTEIGRSGRYFYIDWNVSANTIKEGVGVPLAKGEMVTFDLTGTPDNLSIRAGVLSSAGKKKYISGKGRIFGVIEITQAGTYTFFVENTNSKKINAEGYINM